MLNKSEESEYTHTSNLKSETGKLAQPKIFNFNFFEVLTLKKTTLTHVGRFDCKLPYRFVPLHAGNAALPS